MTLHANLRALRAPSSARQRGMTLLQVALILLLLGALIASGFQVLQSRTASRQSEQQAQALSWADQAITAFAAANSRLPCPASTPEGKEDCASGNSKGYLPVATLDTFFDANSSSIIGASGGGKLPSPVLYAVNRPAAAPAAAPYAASAGTSIDLALASARYSPPAYNGEDNVYEARDDFEVPASTPGAPATAFEYDAINGLDFCASLGQAAVAGSSGLSTTVAGSSRVIAYGVAVAGPDAGSNGRFDDANLSNALTLADPAKENAADYDDRVRVRTFESLAQLVGCSLLTSRLASNGRVAFADNVPVSSLDLLADAAGIDDSVKDTQESTVGNAEDAVAGGQQAVAFGTIGVVMAGVDVAAAGLDLAEAIVLLAQNVVRCAVSLGIECWRVPLSTAALVKQSVALGLNIAALAQNIAALGQNSAALSEADVVLRLANSAVEANATSLAEAIQRARDSAYGVCKDHRDPLTGAVSSVCDPKGLKQTSEEAEAEAKAAETKRDAYYNQYMLHWEDRNLQYRIQGWGGMSTTERNRQLNLLRYQLQTARDYMDALIAFDVLKADQKNYAERLKQFQSLIDQYDDSDADRAKALAECNKKGAEADRISCRAALEQIAASKSCEKEPSEIERIVCESSASNVAYVKTCVRDGVLEQFVPTVNADGTSASTAGPYCIPALKDAIVYNNGKMAEHQVIVDRLYDNAASSGATKEFSNVWIEPVKDADGNVVTAGYWVTSAPYASRYPPGNQWPFCSAEMIQQKQCNSLTALFPYWKNGNYLPLIRRQGSGFWLSYGDAYREHKTRAQVAAKSRANADTTASQFAAAVAGYQQLLKVAFNNSNSAGTELWLGPNQTVKAADDRGAVGPDRNAAVQSAVSP